jgi:hypothetical protein
MYLEKGLNSPEIAKKFDVHKDTILDALKKHGIERRNTGESRKGNRKKCTTFHTSTNGYETIVATNGEKSRSIIYVHRLVAIAEGADANAVFSGKHVHHKNGITWDNRPENLEVMEGSEHMSYHMKLRWENGEFDG